MNPINLAIVLAVIVLGWGILLYNRLRALTVRVDGAWADIATQLQRRHDLVPPLVETVKGYVKAERETLEKVMEARSQATATHGGPGATAPAENALGQALGRLFALVEAYPELKSAPQFIEFQQQLSEIEDQINFARRFYNGNVRDLNTLVGQVPANIVARWFGFGEKEFFALDDARAAEPVDVDFSDLGGAG